ncbi:hypothetical protein CRE_08284 [Caenorhabditis remanei]|uniref:Uncharacterized protein n=1 Tax=Caenorhabditis remanei TaxID=31234 RepID=E3M3G7_CAERE|nr:hypothetical protein CRE_08284 [Caenorhabditis remanei]
MRPRRLNSGKGESERCGHGRSEAWGGTHLREYAQMNDNCWEGAADRERKKRGRMTSPDYCSRLTRYSSQCMREGVDGTTGGGGAG